MRSGPHPRHGNQLGIFETTLRRIIEPRIGTDWYEALKDVIETEYFEKLGWKLYEERAEHNVYPDVDSVFRIFKELALRKVRVVIIGQDPYNTPGVADGLAFSCGRTLRPQPSLEKIMEEVQRSIYGRDRTELPSKMYDLIRWVRQGVFLYNVALTVREGEPASHLSYWKPFSEAVIKAISDHNEGVVFLLWGIFARPYEEFIDTEKHIILKAGHPISAVYSPGHNTWIGCDHFGKVNRLFCEQGKPTIIW